jgi:ankyrin repeat protein
VKGHVEIASLLLKNGADPNSRDDRGRAPLHRVSQGGHIVMVESSLEIARLLVNRGVDVNAIDKEGWTPLHATAARSGYREIAELLPKFGVIPDAPNSNQKSPLHAVACRNGKLNVPRPSYKSWLGHQFPERGWLRPITPDVMIRTR